MANYFFAALVSYCKRASLASSKINTPIMR